MAFKLHILNDKRKLTANLDDCLLDLLHEAGYQIRSDCSRHGVCGQCVVELVEGRAPSPDPWEKALLQRKNRGDEFRLACRLKVQGDLTIRIPPESIAAAAGILSSGLERTIPVVPAIRKRFLPSIIFQSSNTKKQINDALSSLLTHGIEADAPDECSQTGCTAVLRRGELIAWEPGNREMKQVGLAVDVGTTTVAAALVDLKSGKRIDTDVAQNGQVRYGADVMSRLTLAFQNDNGLDRLQHEILITLNGMIAALTSRNGLKSNDIYEMVIASNTVMNHFLLGEPIDTLAVFPFTPHFLTVPDCPADNIGVSLNSAASLVIVPNIGGFVGGDITSGLIACDFMAMKGNRLYIDLGTNGEIVIKKGESLLVTSTAAGPAFEGGNITHGMMAVPGAVYAVDSLDPVQVKTINDEPAQGFCGTGLIDLLAHCLDTGRINSQGAISRNAPIPVGNGMLFSQKDVRQLQMALAAVKSGVKMMLNKCGLGIGDLDHVVIAGAFGNFLNTDHAQRIGLLPPVELSKITFIGNASLAGAEHILISEEARKKSHSLIENAENVSLAAESDFEDIFIQAIPFETSNYFSS